MIVCEYDYLKAKRDKERMERDNILKNNYVEISEKEAIDLGLVKEISDFEYNCNLYPNKHFTDFLLNPEEGNYCLLFIKYYGNNVFEVFYLDKYNNFEIFLLQESKLNDYIFEWISEYNMFNPYCILFKYRNSELEISGGHYNFPDTFSTIYSAYIESNINDILWNNEKYIFENEENYLNILNIGNKSIYSKEFNNNILKLKIDGRKA